MSTIRKIVIASDHPACVGHFPGYPVLPGACILDLVFHEYGKPIRKLLSGKFLRPVHPGSELVIEFGEAIGGSIPFAVFCEGAAVCEGHILPDV